MAKKPKNRITKRNDDFRKAFSHDRCMVPVELVHECVKEFGNSHTISRTRSLSSIERDGRVYGIKRTPGAFDKNDKLFKFEFVGWKKEASTFRGFCQAHDGPLFAPIEVGRFPNNIESYFLLGYRSLCRELYLKLSALELANDSSVESFLSFSKDELAKKKQEYDEILISKNYSDVRSLVISFEQPPPVMASFSILPDFDFSNNKIQDLETINGIEQDIRIVEQQTGQRLILNPAYVPLIKKLKPELLNEPDLICCNSFFDGTRGKLVFTWTKSSESSCNKLSESLLILDSSEIPSYLLQFIFGYSENCYLSPNWWDQLTHEQRQLIEGQINQSVKGARPEYRLTPDWADIPFPAISQIEHVPQV